VGTRSGEVDLVVVRDNGAYKKGICSDNQKDTQGGNGEQDAGKEGSGNERRGAVRQSGLRSSKYISKIQDERQERKKESHFTRGRWISVGTQSGLSGGGIGGE